jgi:hypothetical protein
MKKVKLNTESLLGIVRENLVKHMTEHAEAVEDHKVLAAKIAKENSKKAKVNVKLANAYKLADMVGFKAIPAAPTEYSKEYNRAIRMLELSVEPEIELEEAIFNQLVMDEWSWKQNFTTSNSMYKTMAGSN